jgi:hypothetical protein
LRAMRIPSSAVGAVLRDRKCMRLDALEGTNKRIHDRVGKLLRKLGVPVRLEAELSRSHSAE